MITWIVLVPAIDKLSATVVEILLHLQKEFMCEYMWVINRIKSY